MKRFLTTYVGVAILAWAQMASAQFTNLASLPFTNSYEFPLLVGDSILANTNAGAWSGVEGSSAYVTNVSYSPSTSYPLPGETHSNIVVFASDVGEIVNAFDTNATVFFQKIWVDTMVQPVFSEELPLSESITNAPLSICFLSSNGFGYVSIYHGSLDYVDSTREWESVQSDSNFWSTFASPQIVSSQWVRLSITLSYINYGYGRPCFSVKINGIALTNEFGFTDDTFVTKGGSWFRCATDSKLMLTELSIAGTGGLDDLLVSDTEPVLTVYPTIFVQAFGLGSITPSGTVILPADGASTNFEIDALSMYRYIQSLKTNNATVADAWDQQTYTLSWSNVVGNNTLDINFAERLSSNGIPYEWLAANGLGTNDVHAGVSNQWNYLAAGDWDLDGMTTFEEWIAGTQPKDSNSLLRIISESMSNGVPVIKWLSSTGTLNNMPYTFEVSSNLVNPAAWILLPTNVAASGTGTNTLLAPVAPEMTPAFFRVTVTNTYTPAP